MQNDAYSSVTSHEAKHINVFDQIYFLPYKHV